MNCNMVSQTTKLAAMFAVVGALAAIGMTTPTTAFAQDKETPPGIANQADENVHTNTGGVGSAQDFRFHEGLCQAGISTEDLEEATGGAGCAALSPPGSSGGVRQD
jgi:hypothetical protein